MPRKGAHRVDLVVRQPSPFRTLAERLEVRARELHGRRHHPDDYERGFAVGAAQHLRSASEELANMVAALEEELE